MTVFRLCASVINPSHRSKPVIPTASLKNCHPDRRAAPSAARNGGIPLASTISYPLSFFDKVAFPRFSLSRHSVFRLCALCDKSFTPIQNLSSRPPYSKTVIPAEEPRLLRLAKEGSLSPFTYLMLGQSSLTNS